MNDTTQTHPPAFILARAMFRAQKLEGDSVADDATFQEHKDEWMPLGRKMLKILENQGYALTKIGDG